MDVSITLAELGMIILFLVVLTAGVYAVITLRSINAVSSEFSALLRRHRSDLDQLSKSVPHIAEISLILIILLLLLLLFIYGSNPNNPGHH